MLRKFVVHLKNNLVGYVALFAALGGTSYAAVRLTPGSVNARALGSGVVTHAKLARNSVNGRNVIDGTLTSSDFAAGALKAPAAPVAPSGASGAPGPAGANGNAAIVTRGRGTGTVGAPHGATTDVPIGSGAWTQAPGEVDLVVGSVTMTTPSTCTGSFGNSLLVKVDGTPATFAVAPTSPASTTITVPVVVTSVMEAASSTTHHVTAALANSCTKAGEDYSVSDVKVDVVKFS
ncbi:MAG: collagen-like protein [Solirubrobacterales bacterium]|nr:collagen-like protein [Solirubrobacterales bacterium]